MVKRNSTTIRVSVDVRDKINSLTRELTSIENRDFGAGETLRRTINIPKLPDILKEDARMKKDRRR